MIRILLLPLLVGSAFAQLTPAEVLIEGGHWKRARSLVEARFHENPGDALANYLLSQIRGAFNDESSTPLTLAERAVALDGRTAKYHRQVAEILGYVAQHSNAIQQVFLARRFRKEIDLALELDPRDTQALRDSMEFYLMAPGLLGGDPGKAPALARQIGDVQAPLGFLAEARIAEFRKQMIQTEAALVRAARASPPNYAAHVALAKFYLDPAHGQADRAEAQAREALKLDGTRVGAYVVLSEVLAQRGDWTRLDANLTAAAAAVPDDLAPYYRAAERTVSEHADAARAERYLRVYLSREPEGNQPTAEEASRLLEQTHRK